MSVEYFITVSIICVGLLLLVIVLIPTEKRVKKKKKMSHPVVESPPKEMEDKVSRLAKHIEALNRKIDILQKSEKENAKELMVERVKIKKLQEKLSQEREWHSREQGNIDKKNSEYHQLKAELVAVQESFSKEHAANLRFTHKIKELEQNIKELTDRRRTLEADNAQLKARCDQNRQEIAQLKKENIQLQKKKDDVQWIAKSEYERVVRLLKENEKELERVTRKANE